MTVIARADGKLVAIDERKSSPFPDQRTTNVRGSRTLELNSLGFSEAYASIYSSQPWVYAAANKLARGLARLPLKCYRDENGRQEYLRPRDQPAHPLPVLFSRPFPRGSRFKLIESLVGNLAIYGNAAWWKYRPKAGRAPIELWPLDWRYMTYSVGGPSGVEFYEYNGPAGRRRFVPEDIVHFQWWSPKGPAGTSPLEPLRITLALEDAGRRYAVSSFTNGIRPSGALVTPKTLDPEQRRQLREEIQAANAGPDAAFRIALLDGGMDWKAFAHTAQEAETIAHRKLNREEACGVYDIPPPALQILDRATFSNITEQNKALYRETLGPPATMIAETIEAQLLWGEPEYAGTFVEFDFDKVLEADLVTRAAAMRSLETTYTANERRKLENLEPIGDADDDANPANGLLVPLNMAIVLPNGDLVVPASADGATGGMLGAALEQIVDDRIAERLALVPADVPVTVADE